MAGVTKLARGQDLSLVKGKTPARVLAPSHADDKVSERPDDPVIRGNRARGLSENAYALQTAAKSARRAEW
jgi:hypothetical protein